MSGQIAPAGVATKMGVEGIINSGAAEKPLRARPRRTGFALQAEHAKIRQQVGQILEVNIAVAVQVAVAGTGTR